MQKVSGIVEGFRGAERNARRWEREGDGRSKGWKERRKASRLRKKVQSASRLILEEEEEEEERYTDSVSVQQCLSARVVSQREGSVEGTGRTDGGYRSFFEFVRVEHPRDYYTALLLFSCAILEYDCEIRL